MENYVEHKNNGQKTAVISVITEILRAVEHLPYISELGIETPSSSDKVRENLITKGLLSGEGAIPLAITLSSVGRTAGPAEL